MVDIIAIHYSSFLVISYTYFVVAKKSSCKSDLNDFRSSRDNFETDWTIFPDLTVFSCGRVQNGKFHSNGDEVPSDNEGTPLVAVQNHDKHFDDSVFRNPCKPFSRKPDYDMIVWLNDCDEGCLW